MSEQGWLGNGAADLRIVGRLCDCPPEARHSDACSWTPIYAELREILPLPNPWTDWPMNSVYIAMFPDPDPDYVQWFMGNLPVMLMPPNPIFDPKYIAFDPKYIAEEGNWALPSYDIGDAQHDFLNEWITTVTGKPPWVTRQENPEL